MPHKDPVKRREYQAEYHKEWRKNKYKTHSEYKQKMSLKCKRRRDNKRRLVLGHYGGKCGCCGESRYEFLALDHINNDGAAHRRDNGITNLVAWAFNNDFPDILQVLCHNCNMAKGFYGICPHQLEGK